MKKLVLACCLSALFVSTPLCANATVVEDSTGGKVYNCTAKNLPTNVKSLLDSCNIYISDKTINSFESFKEYPSNAWGVYSGDKKNIFVSTQYGNTEAVSHVLTHELGHALDAFTKSDELKNDDVHKVYYIAGWSGKYSTTTEFKALKDKYYKTLKPYSQELYFDDVSEFFAECYAMYKEHPELRSEVPDLYTYYDKLISTYKLEINK